MVNLFGELKQRPPPQLRQQLGIQAAVGSLLFMVPILMTNLTNGFSGIAIYTDLYYAMFDVLNTVFILAAFLILDQDVAFNTERYNNDDQDIQQIKDSPN